MKKLLTLGAVALMAASTYGQGLVTFNNRDTANSILAPVFDTDTVTGVKLATGLTGTQARIALLGGAASATAASCVFQNGGNVGTLSLLASPNTSATWVNFSTTRAGFAGVPSSDTVRAVTGVDFGGNTAQLQLVAWTGNFDTWTAAFAAALTDPTVHVGASAAWTVKTGADALAFPPINTGMAGFNILSIAPIPEPSTMALAGLGAAALLIFRRRK